MKKQYDDDDGRTIADMSGLNTNSVLTGMFVGGNISRREKRSHETASQRAALEDASGSRVGSSDYQESYEEKKTRHLYAFGAMRAGLLIGLVYLAAFAAFIVLLLLIWGKL